jgi:hypothetical protein
MKNILHIAAGLIAIVIGGLGVMKSTDNPSSSFKIYADMDSSGWFAGGYLCGLYFLFLDLMKLSGH